MHRSTPASAFKTSSSVALESWCRTLTKASSGTTPVVEGVVVFSHDGSLEFGYKTQFGDEAVDIADCYALYPDNAQVVWFVPYPRFPLVQLELPGRRQDVPGMPGPFHESHAMCATDDAFFFHSNYKEDASILAWSRRGGLVEKVGEWEEPTSRHSRRTLPGSDRERGGHAHATARGHEDHSPGLIARPRAVGLLPARCGVALAPGPSSCVGDQGYGLQATLSSRARGRTRYPQWRTPPLPELSEQSSISNEGQGEHQRGCYCIAQDTQEDRDRRDKNGGVPRKAKTGVYEDKGEEQSKDPCASRRILRRSTSRGGLASEGVSIQAQDRAEKGNVTGRSADPFAKIRHRL